MANQTFYIRLNGSDRHRYECVEPFRIAEGALTFTHETPVIKVNRTIMVEYVEFMRDDEVVAKAKPKIAICLNAYSSLNVFYTFIVIDEEMKRRRNAHLN